MKTLLWIRYRYLLNGWQKFFMPEGKKGKRGIGKIIGLSLLLLYAFGAIVAGVTWFSVQMSVFVDIGLDWLYFSMAFLAGMAMTLLGSVYTTQNQLYNARDNELLLAMPVKMEHICLSRMVFLLAGAAGYMALITLPAFLVYWVRYGMTLPVFFGYLVLFLCMVLFCQTISCVLGWILHKILARIRSKAIGALLFMTVFMVVYFWVYSRVMAQFEDILGQMAAIGADLAELFSDLGGFFIWLGRGCMGNLPSLLILCGITAATAVLGYYFLIATYRSSLLASAPADKPVVKTAKASGMHSAVMAVCIKECRRFFTCSIYLMNMGLGVVLMLIGGIAGIVMRGQIMETLTEAGEFRDIALLVFFLMIFGFLISTAAITAPSISLEGKSLWIFGSLPVDGSTILHGKLLFHVLATVPVSVPVVLVLGIVYGIAPFVLILLLLYAALMPVLTGILGLLTGLRFPRFDWLNEAYPCKQSIAVMITMFGMMGISFASMGLFLLGAYLGSGLGTGTAVLIGTGLAVLLPLLLTGILYWVLRRWGGRRMEMLLQN